MVPPRQRALSLDIPPQAELCMWLLAKLPSARLPSACVLDMTLRASSHATLGDINP